MQVCLFYTCLYIYIYIYMYGSSYTFTAVMNWCMMVSSYLLISYIAMPQQVYGTAQTQLDAHAYITRGFFTCFPSQPVRVHTYMLNSIGKYYIFFVNTQGIYSNKRLIIKRSGNAQAVL